jgi:hypothetical protein
VRGRLIVQKLYHISNVLSIPNDTNLDCLGSEPQVVSFGAAGNWQDGVGEMEWELSQTIAYLKRIVETLQS